MQSTKFECQLAPVGDPNMKVEWFLNGKPLPYSKFNIDFQRRIDFCLVFDLLNPFKWIFSKYNQLKVSIKNFLIATSVINHFKKLIIMFIYREQIHSDLRLWLRGHELWLGVPWGQWRVLVQSYQPVRHGWNASCHQDKWQAWYHLRLSAAQGNEEYWEDQRPWSRLANVSNLKYSC